MTRFTPTMLKVEKMERTWNPVSVFFGNNSSKLLGYTLELLQSKNVFLVTDKFLYENTSMVKDLESVLDDYQITRDVYKNVQPEPKLEVAEDIANAVRRGNYNAVVGIGGGSVLDMAKVAAGMATNDGAPKSYLGANKFTNSALPLVLIPTTAGTGSEVTSRAMVTADEKAVFADDILYAKVALVDPKLTASMPPKVTADTGFDAMCHALEGVLSKEKFYGVEKEVEEDGYEAVRIIAGNIRNAVKDGSNLQTREYMMRGSLLAGFVLSKKAMVYGHSMGYPFAPKYNIPHGRSVIMALPYIMQFYGARDEDSKNKISRIAKDLDIGKFWQSNGIKVYETVNTIKGLIDEVYGNLNLPITLNGIGVKKEELPAMAKLCLEKWPRLASPVQASELDILGLYNQMWEGKL